MKNNTLITTVNNATTTVKTVKNSEKTNTILSLTEVKKLFCEVGITPKYTDSANYVGCGTRSNTFSVNVKKTKYNVYCSDDTFKLFDTKKYKQCLFVDNGNSVDKTRPNYIECKSTNELKSLLKIVLDNNSKIALQK